MLKLVLSRLFFEIVEDIVALDQRLAQARHHVDASQQVVVDYLLAQVDQLRQDTLSHRQALVSVLEDTVAGDELETVIYGLLSEQLPTAVDRLHQLTQLLYQMDSRQIQSEANQVLGSLNLNRLMAGDNPGVVLMPVASREGVYLEDRHQLRHEETWAVVQDVPLLSLNNPLHWFGLTDYFMQAFSTRTVQVASLIEELQLGFELPLDMLCPLFNLRLLGPSYYAHYVLQSLKEGYQPWFWIVEPTLFQGLNRFGFVNKDLVILHQSLEKARAFVEDGTEDNDELKLSDKDREALLGIVEKIIPDILAFVEKHYQRAQLLGDRLEQGVLISAVPMMVNPSQLHDTLVQQLASDESFSMYPLLASLKESPAKPVEILNAGFLYKLEKTPLWVRYALTELDDDEAWTFFTDKILSLQNVLAKSIETARVFEVLDGQAPDGPQTRVGGPSLKTLRQTETELARL
ncbi:MAG: hypothetical protein KC475_00780 [Cyanobacteria bacterium HKST-UBA03]|nr:hypothetical protein [Cyanobacteria bacterium HKST-UBA05]MCA9840623.1 hypothetical protein [Cyanobacteria bacterium HKST-UBA03]